MSWKRVRQLIGGLALILILVSACGGGASESQATPEPTFDPLSIVSPAVPAGTAVATATRLPSPSPTINATLPADLSLMTQEMLLCNGTTKTPPCEDRKIRIRGYDNPLSTGALVAGQSYGWFPIAQGIPWIIAVHEGVGPQGFPMGYAFDAGTLMEFVKEDDAYYYVRHPDHLVEILFTLSKAEVTSAFKPSAPFFMKPVSANWCPIKPEGRWSAKIGEVYNWYSIGIGVQFSMLELYPNPEELMNSGRMPNTYQDHGVIVVKQDFEPYTLMGILKDKGVWLKDANGVLYWAPNMFCDYWPDVQP